MSNRIFPQFYLFIQQMFIEHLLLRVEPEKQNQKGKYICGVCRYVCIYYKKWTYIGHHGSLSKLEVHGTGRKERSWPGWRPMSLGLFIGSSHSGKRIQREGKTVAYPAALFEILWLREGLSFLFKAFQLTKPGP